MKLNAAEALLFCILLTSPCDAPRLEHPGHMLSGVLDYQILQRESLSAIPAVRSLWRKIPWYGTRWKAQLGTLQDAERDEMLFMLAARWTDEIERWTEPRAPSPQDHPQRFAGHAIASQA